MRFGLKSAAAAATVMLVAGCATITTGSAQSVTITTDPPGADCTFSREGILLARVNPTPGTIQVGKSSSEIAVLCQREGYQDTKGAVGSEFQAATLGNIILGGIIGVVVDAASGAMTKYPDSVSFTLIPIEFATDSARDAFFEELRATFLVEYSEVVARIKQSCSPQDCEGQLRAAEAARASRLSDIERRRLLAKVAVR